MGTSGEGALTSGVKWPWRETDNSPPSSAEVKKGGAIPPLPQYVFMASRLIKQKMYLDDVVLI
jgi:hypothetical protein